VAEAIGQRWSLHELEHQRLNAIGLLEAIDRADVRMIKRSKNARFAIESREAVRIARERRGRT
jgi:hypothetical protein